MLGVAGMTKSWVGWSTASAGLAALSAVAVLMTATGDAKAQQPAAHPGRVVYEKYCGSCHDNPEATRSPSLSTLMQRNEPSLRAALTTGKMQQQGAMVPGADMYSLLDYLAVKAPLTDEWLTSNACPVGKRGVDLSRPSFTYQGVEPSNVRHISARQSGLKTADLAGLEVAWTFGFPQTTELRAAPVIVGSTIFNAASLGYVVALDTRTGCVKWSYKSPTILRTSMTYGDIGRTKALVFADAAGMVQAIDARTGKLIWIADGRHEPEGFLTGAPMIWKDKIIVPVSSTDVQKAQNSTFECCKGHGAVVALNAADGKHLWAAHATEPAKPTGKKSSVGTTLWGPSGAIVWSSPAIDPKTRTVYVGTGENYSLPVTDTSDAIWAIDIDTGKTRWFFQALARDAWNLSCNRGPNCPDASESILKDFDFGAGPIVVRTGGRDLIFGGQKSGDVWALDTNGKEVWRQKFGQGSALGGIHWGIASDGKRLFIPVAGGGGEGLHTLDTATGKLLWSAEAQCIPGPGRAGAPPPAPVRGSFACRGAGLSAAILSVDGAVVTATLDGRVVIFNTADGKVLASHNTNTAFTTVNGVPGKGGSIDAQTIAAGDGMLFVGSGYGQFGQTPGNVLVAYRPKRR